MRYTGNKSRITKHILPIILKDRKPNQWFVEPFVGGANITDKVDGLRLASDYNKHLIEFYKALQDGWTPPLRVSKTEYEDIKQNQERDSKMTVWVGICCSYGGKWFGGYLSDYQESKRLKSGRLPNHQDEARRGLMLQIPNLISVHFVHSDYTVGCICSFFIWKCQKLFLPFLKNYIYTLLYECKIKRIWND